MPAMREAIEQYVAREEERERLRQDASAGWEKYQADGLHVTAIEADACSPDWKRAKTPSRWHATPDSVAIGIT